MRLSSHFATKQISKHKQELETKNSLVCNRVDIVSTQAGEQTKPVVMRRVLHAQAETSGLDVLTDRQSKGQESHLPIKKHLHVQTKGAVTPKH